MNGEQILSRISSSLKFPVHMKPEVDELLAQLSLVAATNLAN